MISINHATFLRQPLLANYFLYPLTNSSTSGIISTLQAKRASAGVVQLVECFLAKEEVVGSNPIARSNSRSFLSDCFFIGIVTRHRQGYRFMANELQNFYNLNTDKDIQESLRLALMFKEEVDEATLAYLEMLHLSIDTSTQSPEEIAKILREAINSAVVTGIRTYRIWLQSQGIEVKTLEEQSGKDIPLDFFHQSARYPL
jgi:hypothetical protein